MIEDDHDYEPAPVREISTFHLVFLDSQGGERFSTVRLTITQDEVRSHRAALRKWIEGLPRLLGGELLSAQISVEHSTNIMFQDSSGIGEGGEVAKTNVVALAPRRVRRPTR